MHRLAALSIVLLVAACASAEPPATGRYSMTAAQDNNRTATAGQPAPLDPTRPISDRDCSRPIDAGGGNLRCH
jgi:hypothetical protein